MNSAARLRRDLDALSAIGRDENGGWSRPAFGEADCAAHEWFTTTATDAGLSVKSDAFGNVIARLEGDVGAPAIMIGSHLDTVTQGGSLDGALGVLAGLEVARRLHADGSQKRVPIEIVAFRDEEGRFGAFTGSRCMMGLLPVQELDRMRSADGAVLADAMRAAGLQPENAGSARRDPAEIYAYLELHIEQGPVLENLGCAIGVVDAIAGQERITIRFTGAPDHAGTTPMSMRRDAFAAAARFADRFRDLILAEGGNTARGTIGIARVTPNLGNVVPSEVRLALEIRDTSAAQLAHLVERTTQIANDAAQTMNVGCNVRSVYRAAPVPMDHRLRGELEAAARKIGQEPVVLASGAGHDAAILGTLVPSGLLFVPSVGGRSHCPEEHTEWSDIESGVAVLEHCVRQLCATAHDGLKRERR